jgi:CheY-like chemotaxis protein
MLTARNSGDDVVTGLDAGADDYVVKPYDHFRAWWSEVASDIITATHSAFIPTTSRR